MSQAVVNLYLVPTPIGNLRDITLRAIDTLQAVDVILAEDTRTSGILLKHLQISKNLQSYHSFNEHKAVEKLVERMRKGETFALISDAGPRGWKYSACQALLPLCLHWWLADYPMTVSYLRGFYLIRREEKRVSTHW